MKKLIALFLILTQTAGAATATRFTNTVTSGTASVGGKLTAGSAETTGAQSIGGSLAVGIVSAADSKAALDVVSTTKGFLPPRMTTVQRDAITSPTTGLIIFNTTTNAANIYNGSAWAGIGGGSFTTQDFSGTTITTTDAGFQRWRYTGVSAQILTAFTNTLISDAGMLMIIGTSDTNTIQIDSATTGVVLNGTWVGYTGSVLLLNYDSTLGKLYEVSRNGI